MVFFREYLIQRVDCEGLFDSHPECKNFVIEALKFHLAGVAAYQVSQFAFLQQIKVNEKKWRFWLKLQPLVQKKTCHWFSRKSPIFFTKIGQNRRNLCVMSLVFKKIVNIFGENRSKSPKVGSDHNIGFQEKRQYFFIENRSKSPKLCSDHNIDPRAFLRASANRRWSSCRPRFSRRRGRSRGSRSDCPKSCWR
jgi:hypothetical protein